MEFRELNINNAVEVHNLQNDIIERLENKDLLRNNSLELISQSLERPNIAIGIYDNDLLVACNIIVVEGEQTICNHFTNNYAGKAGYYKIVMVRDGYRGQGFQRQLTTLAEEKAKEAGIDYLWLTVSPENPFSKNNFLKAGYKFDHQEVKYGGKLRDILVKIL